MDTTDVLENARAKACCSDLYESDLARLVLGDTLHPGGLALTNRLGKLLDIQPSDWVVDLASARGASAMAVSRVFSLQCSGSRVRTRGSSGSAGQLKRFSGTPADLFRPGRCGTATTSAWVRRCSFLRMLHEPLSGQSSGGQPSCVPTPEGEGGSA